MNIGPALKYLRNKKGLTLDEVANSLNKRVAKEDVEDIKFNKGKISLYISMIFISSYYISCHCA